MIEVIVGSRIRKCILISYTLTSSHQKVLGDYFSYRIKILDFELLEKHHGSTYSDLSSLRVGMSSALDGGRYTPLTIRIVTRCTVDIASPSAREKLYWKICSDLPVGRCICFYDTENHRWTTRRVYIQEIIQRCKKWHQFTTSGIFSRVFLFFREKMVILKDAIEIFIDTDHPLFCSLRISLYQKESPMIERMRLENIHEKRMCAQSCRFITMGDCHNTDSRTRFSGRNDNHI